MKHPAVLEDMPREIVAIVTATAVIYAPVPTVVDSPKLLHAKLSYLMLTALARPVLATSNKLCIYTVH